MPAISFLPGRQERTKVAFQDEIFLTRPLLHGRRLVRDKEESGEKYVGAHR